MRDARLVPAREAGESEEVGVVLFADFLDRNFLPEKVLGDVNTFLLGLSLVPDLLVSCELDSLSLSSATTGRLRFLAADANGITSSSEESSCLGSLGVGVFVGVDSRWEAVLVGGGASGSPSDKR